MKIASRLRYSFGIMLLAVLLIGVAAAAVMLRTAGTLTRTLSRTFEAVAVMEMLGEQTRQYNVVASGFAAESRFGEEESLALDRIEADMEASLVRLNGLDPANAAAARQVIADDVAQSRSLLKDTAGAAIVPAPAVAPAPEPSRNEAPTAVPKAGKKSKQLPRKSSGARPAPARAAAQPEAAPAASPDLAAFSQLQGRRVLNELHDRVTRALGDIRDAQRAAVDTKLTDTARETVRFMVLLLALALAAVVAIAFLFMGMRKGVLRPVQALADVARRVSAERDLTVPVAVSGDDEVQNLGRAFANMMETLRSITVEMRGATDRLLSASSELGGITRAQGESMARQATALEEARRTSTSLRTSSRSAAAQAESVLHVAQRAEELGRDGEAAMTESLSSADEIQGQTRQVVERIVRLATSAQRIAAITGAVKDLADQSNVLALNAAIEASRAGEAGAGFAVVAREIRSLADRSIKATVEVRTVLAEVVAGIRDAAGLVEAASTGLAQGTDRTRRLGDSVSGLTGIVRENLGAVRQIAGTVASQDSGIGQINAAVEDLAMMMEETLRTVKTTGEAAGMLREVSEQVSSAVKAFRL